MPVMGGIMVLLFGSIAGIGLKTLLDARVNLSSARNLCIVGPSNAPCNAAFPFADSLLPIRHACYSYLSASMGSTLVARRAGI